MRSISEATRRDEHPSRATEDDCNRQQRGNPCSERQGADDYRCAYRNHTWQDIDCEMPIHGLLLRALNASDFTLGHTCAYH
jgi:hypothetical protein